MITITEIAILGARRVRRLRGDLEGAEHAALADDAGHQRDPRDRAARRAVRDAPGNRALQQGHPRDRDCVRDDQHRRWVPRDRPDARDVQAKAGLPPTPKKSRPRAGPNDAGATVFLQQPNFLDASTSSRSRCSSTGCRADGPAYGGARQPDRRGRNGDRDLADAARARHVLSGSSAPWLIALGVVIGAGVGVPAARRVRMTRCRSWSPSSTASGAARPPSWPGGAGQRRVRQGCEPT